MGSSSEYGVPDYEGVLPGEEELAGIIHDLTDQMNHRYGPLSREAIKRIKTVVDVEIATIQ